MASSNNLKTTLTEVVMGLSDESVSLPWKLNCLVGAVGLVG